MKKTQNLKPVVYLLILFAGLATSGSVFAAETYNLGVALGLSGTGSQYSKEAVNAIETAVNEINIQGGLLRKYPIKLFIRDTKTQPDESEKVVNKLIFENKVRAVIGCYSSASAIAIKPLCRQNSVLHIATISNSENITKKDFSPYTFSMVPNSYMMSKAVAMGVAKLAKKEGWTKYVTIASDYEWGRSNQEIQVDQLRRIAPELQLVEVYWPPLGQTLFNAFIVDIMAKKPHFILSTIGGNDNAYWMRDARDFRLFKKIAAPGGLISVSELINHPTSVRRGIYARTRAPFFAHMNIAMMANFVHAYKDKYGMYPSDWAVMSYDGVYAIRQGVERAGSMESEKVKDALRGMTINTTRGELFFRKIDNQLNCSAYFGRIADSDSYPIPIYDDLLEIKGEEIWRPEDEILAARK